MKSKNRLLLFLSLLLCTTACQQEEKQEAQARIIINNPELTEGGRFYGGVLRINYSRYPENFYPPAVTSREGKAIMSQLYETLFRLDEQGEIVPLLAESFTVNADRTRYRIDLKSGIYFHDDPAFPKGKGRELKANDIIYVLKRLCTYHPENKYADLFVPHIKGAQSYYQRSQQKDMGDILPDGLAALGGYQISITLNAPDPFFLQKLTKAATAIYPREMIENFPEALQKYAVGTGPFELEHAAKDITIVLKKNPAYHQTDEFDNPLPYLDALSYQFIKDQNTELREFVAGKLDILHGLDNERVTQLLMNSRGNGKGEFKEMFFCLEPSPQITMLSIMPTKKILRSLNFRKALNFALNRQKIMQEAINNEAFSAAQGAVPPIEKAYPTENLQSYRFSLDSALHYLELSGYQFGAESPLVISYNQNKNGHKQIAGEIADELLGFGILAEAQALGEEEWQQNARRGNYDLLLFDLEASSPAEFLYQFYPLNLKTMQKQPIQTYSFSRPFIEYFRQSQQASSRKEVYSLLTKAQQALLDEAAAIYLWYGGKNTVVRSYIENYPCQKAVYPSLSKVYYRKAINI
jgi:oligopeptide transport system substrate-binding protein